MNLVYRHRSGGAIWQGGEDDVEFLLRRPGATRISVIALMAKQYQPADASVHYDVLRGRLDDNFFPGKKEYAWMSKVGDDVSGILARYVAGGHEVLSSCQMGLNRSGLATALTVMRLTRSGCDTCTALVKRARGRLALSNPAFRSIVRDKERAWGVGVTLGRPRGLVLSA